MDQQTVQRGHQKKVRSLGSCTQRIKIYYSATLCIYIYICIYTYIYVYFFFLLFIQRYIYIRVSVSLVSKRYMRGVAEMKFSSLFVRI